MPGRTKFESVGVQNLKMCGIICHMSNEKSLELLAGLCRLSPPDKFIVAEDADILDGLSFAPSREELAALLDGLKEDGDIKLKFSGDGEWCFAVTERAGKTLALAEAVKSVADATPVTGADDDGKTEPARRKKNAPKRPSGFARTFFASLSGSVLGGGLVVVVYYLATTLSV